jgi:hypothetical protein
MKEDEIGRAWERKGMHRGFWWECQKEDLHVGGRILKWYLRQIGWGGMD